MKYSQLPFKTSKTVSRDMQSKNARLLLQAGFIHQEMAGVYTFLPMGLRVLNKIKKIIREEMDTIGVEIQMTSLAPIEIWEKTGRKDTVDVLMKTLPANDRAKVKNDSEYVLGSTHEEMVTPLVMEFNRSYKDFPFAVYQIQTKFRNEPRAKSGLLRCREFLMKDLYSFHTSEEDLKNYYEKAKHVYWETFKRFGFEEKDTFLTLASGGDFTKDYSHEFQTICDAGEDMVFHAKSAQISFNREVAPSKAPEMHQETIPMLPMEEVKGEGLIGVEEVAKMLNISPEQTTKTLLFENEKGEIIAAAVRGGYDINEEKLRKVSDSERVTLASVETVRNITGADVGYAGILNLPKSVRIFMDESMKGRRNFEMGANRTHYHSRNVNFERDVPLPDQFYDIKTAKQGDAYPETGEIYDVYKTAEIGNIFPLNVKFSKAFGYVYTNDKGEKKEVYMGSYGIGPSRIMGVLVEKYADDKGLVWPKAVAPFQVHVISLHQNERADVIYQTLTQKGIEVFYDDRDISTGAKFADCDLFGIPIRLVVSAKTEEKIEWKNRSESHTSLLTLEEVIQKLQ